MTWSLKFAKKKKVWTNQEDLFWIKFGFALDKTGLFFGKHWIRRWTLEHSHQRKTANVRILVWRGGIGLCYFQHDGQKKAQIIFAKWSNMPLQTLWDAFCFVIFNPHFFYCYCSYKLLLPVMLLKEKLSQQKQT